MSSPVETRDEALCVRVLWGERRLATHLVRSEPLELREGLPLRFDAEAGFGVSFAPGVAGELVRHGETPLALGDAVHRGLARETPRGWRLEVGRKDLLRLRRGALTVEAHRVRAPARAVAALDEQLDYRFLNTLLVCFALAFGLLAQASFEVEAFDDDSLDARQLATLRRVLVKPAPPPRPARAEPVPEKEPAKVAEVRASTPPREGRPKPPSKPQRDTGGLTAAAFGRHVFGPGLSGVLGPGGLGKELEGALGHVSAANGDGFGGWSLRGDGAGGPGGERIGIGGIATSGVAKRGGIGRLCGGPGPCKASTTPVVEVSEPIACGGEDARACMDKELIRKVIASHRDQLRYCYELALQSAPSLAGKVALAFAVAPSGDVAAASVQQTTVGNPALETCLVSRVRTWRFPVPARSPGFRVTYPFLFKPPQ
jgi:TonB family protein